MPPRTTDAIDRLIGERVRAARLAARISQTNFGRLVGVSFQQVQKYERAENRISASMIVKMASILQVPHTSLLPSDDDRLDPRVDIGSLPGGYRMAAAYKKMSSTQRRALLAVAEEFSCVDPR